MSRIGNKPVAVPSGVKVRVADKTIHVGGPKGELQWSAHPDMMVEFDESAAEIRVRRPSDVGFHRALHGLTRSLIANMVEGVSQGFEKRLEIVGVGYNARVQGADLVLNMGFSHPVTMSPPEGVTVEAPAPTQIVIKGVDKQVVGQFAAEIRKVRKPEPYKGKGIRYEGEQVRRKAGKSFTSGAM
jgi:large subunit ribosomal protein L6